MSKKKNRRKRSSPNVVEMAATETITSIILIKLIRVSLGTVMFFFSSRRRHTRSLRDWSSDVCSSDLIFRLDNSKQEAAAETARRKIAEVEAELISAQRSEERRVGKECRSRWSSDE